MTQLQAALVAWAQSNIGVKETAPNSGPEIDGWLALRGLPPGEPWCAAFACAGVEVAADELELQPASFHPSASTQRLWMANPSIQVQDPQPGDIYVLRHSASTGHCGIVETVDDDGTVATEISGNTFEQGGGREGNCVARHMGPAERTHGGTLLGYLRIG